MFEETGKTCFADTSLKERMFSISSKEMVKKLGGDAVKGDTANILADNAHALSDIKTSANPTVPSEQAAHIIDQHTQKLENEDRELCNPTQRAASYPEQTVVKDKVQSKCLKKRELLHEKVNGSDILRDAAALGTTLLVGAKGKHIKRDKEGKVQTKEILTRSGPTKSGQPDLDNAKVERKNKLKPRQKTAQLSAAENGLLGKPAEAQKHKSPRLRGKTYLNQCKRLLSCQLKQMAFLASQLKHKSPRLTQKTNLNQGKILLHYLSSWLNFEDDDLPDANDDLMGLAVPMDDITDLNMF
ncbi:hypothetical protein SUGI_1193820 [Cryptomeria japonica]|nr:hypothetical protein SUGI_1193820 [Cryptomeria japonica]